MAQSVFLALAMNSGVKDGMHVFHVRKDIIMTLLLTHVLVAHLAIFSTKPTTTVSAKCVKMGHTLTKIK